MCKVLAIAGIKPDNAQKVWGFAQIMGQLMSKHNTDGLGYAAITSDGKLFGERWLTNSEAFSDKQYLKEREACDNELFETFGEALDGSRKEYKIGEYNNFGESGWDKTVAITLHTRMATSPRGLTNTHPFVADGVSLIHNGVIRNPENYGMKLSTCDSEAILQGYLQESVLADVANIQKLADGLAGYYACAMLSNTEAGPILDVFREGARLHSAYIKELGTWVISTDDDDIKAAAKYFGYTTGEVYRLHENKLLRINCNNPKDITITPFKARSTTYQNYSQGRNENPSMTSATSSTGTGTTNEVTKDNLLPFGKHKNTDKNPQLRKELVPYYTSGKLTCTRLSEREEQEIIHEQERASS